VSPAPQPRTLRRHRIRLGRRRISTAQRDALPATMRGDAFELELELDIRHSTDRAFGVELRHSAADVTVVRYTRADGRLTLDRARSGYGRSGVFGGAVGTTARGCLRLRLLVDRSSIEAFANDGAASVTARVYPRFREDVGVDRFSEGGTTQLRAATMSKLSDTSRTHRPPSETQAASDQESRDAPRNSRRSPTKRSWSSECGKCPDRSNTSSRLVGARRWARWA